MQKSEKKQTLLSSRICTACGTQFPPGINEKNLCPVCSDDRQFIPEEGQNWTTHEELQQERSVQIRRINDHLYELTIAPSFAIGQRAFLVLSEHGNILWDCIPLLDEATTVFIKSNGGLQAIAISHPHYYSNMNDWAATFDCPVYIHEKDEQWVTGESDIMLWNGAEKLLWDDIKIINVGGHFPGSCILYIPFLSERGTILCGDTLYISRSKRHVAVMYSYPNQIPLPVSEVKRIKKLLENLKFDTLYGAFPYQELTEDAQCILTRSMERNLSVN